jgi:hypothetical protein
MASVTSTLVVVSSNYIGMTASRACKINERAMGELRMNGPWVS